jgi:hypothetical protein
MRNYANIGIQIPEVLLPKKGTNFSKWAVIACDQFTSEPEYWEKAAGLVGDSPSTLNLILPEVYLGKPEEAQRVVTTQQHMNQYLKGDLFETHSNLVLVERTALGKTRHGLMLALDLEKYDYNKGSQSLIRATEGTILDRLPPRIRIRKDAPLELPHILVLIDDPEKTVIEPLFDLKPTLTKLYDFELMQGSGYLRGYQVDDLALEQKLITALEKLAQPDTFQKKYGVGNDQGILLFAVGDGNHSLATAKAIWEQIKGQVGLDHPARYALVELENVHDSGLEFEPIHRILFHVKEDLQKAMHGFFGSNFSFLPIQEPAVMVRMVKDQESGTQTFGVVTPQGYGIVEVKNPASNLPVGTLQSFLDDWLKKGGADHIDYVHGEEATLKLGSQPGNLGFFLPPMNKSDLFKTVILDGALPRKTFSMGEAIEKRFYVECRRITK